MQKKPIIIISVLCVISLVLGYLSGLKEEESLSNRDAETDSKKEPEFLKEGLVAYYPFNGKANDESGNGHDGKVAGATLTYDRNGKEGSAYFFDGINDMISLSKSLLDNEKLTISMWFEAKQLTGDNRLLNNNRRLSVRINAEKKLGMWIDGKHEWTVFSPAITIGRWHHLLITLSDDSTNFFFDSKLGGKFSTLSKIVGQEFELGASLGSYGQHFNGKLDDIRIYNRALSAEEVKALYEFEKAK